MLQALFDLAAGGQLAGLAEAIIDVISWED